MPDPIDAPPPAAPVGDAAPASVLSEGMTFTENWRESLPEDIRAEPSLQTMTTVDGLARSYVAAQKMTGLEKVAIPTDVSTPDVWNEFHAKLGRPAAAIDYDFKDVQFSEGIAPTADQETAAKDAMHSLGLSAKQAHGIYDYYKTHMEGELESFEHQQHKSYDDGVAELKTKYGYAYDAKLETANRAKATFDTTGVIDRLGIGNDPGVIDMLAQIGESIAEDKLIGNRGPVVMTPNEAQTDVNKILAGPAYYDETHPSHAADVHEVRRLMKYMHPEDTGASVSPVGKHLI